MTKLEKQFRFFIHLKNNMINNNQEFLKFIEDEINQIDLKSNSIKTFLNKVPYQYHNYVINTIEKIHSGNLESYLKTIPLFLEKFSREEKAFAESSIVKDKKNNRYLSKRKKQAILYAGQLLRCVGGKNMTATAPFAVINEYQYQQQQQELFCSKNKLLNSMGQLVKLTSPKQRRIERNAQNFKQSKAMEEQAISLGYTFAFITLTLPPIYHPNPTYSKRNSYKGATPQEATDTLNHFWKLIRSNCAAQGLKVGEDFFGVRVVEGQKDSCLHGHYLIHISPKNISTLQNIVSTVERNERIRLAKLHNISLKHFKLKWDFKAEWKRNNKKKAKASSYLFKYLSPDVSDKATVANESLRSFYGTRAIQWFGLKNKITTFNHIVKNWKPYENQIDNLEVISMLRSKDLTLFCKKYEQDFVNINVEINGQNKFIGVSYIPNRKTTSSKNEILITKKQFVLVQNEDREIINELGKNMIGLKFQDDINLYNSNLSAVNLAFPRAQKRQSEFNEIVLNYFKNQFIKGIDNFVLALGCFYSETSDKVIKQFTDAELEEQKKNFELNYEHNYFMQFNGVKKVSELELDVNTEFLLLTLKHHYSSKNPSGFCDPQEQPKIPINLVENIVEIY